MAHSATPTSLRVLILTLNLVNTEIGSSKHTLRAVVPGYSSSEVAFERMFERDLVTLRETGLVVDVLGDGQEPRYRINGSSFPAPDVSFSGVQTELLVQAACAWDHLGAVDFSRLLSKLNAYTDEDVAAETSSLTYGLEGSEYLPQVLQAIEKRQPVQFSYASRRGEEERDVAPWSLLVRGKAVYLWGFDLNRWAPRLYRLSRVRSPLVPIGEADAYEIPDDPGQDIHIEVFLIRPLLWIRQGAGELLRLRCEPPLAAADYPEGLEERSGWDLCRGREDDQAVWERMVYDECVNVVPHEPRGLRERIHRQLQVAAMWEGGTDGK